MVKAVDYWQGREPDASWQAAEASRPPIGEQVRQAFVEYLGPVGSHLLDRVLQRMRRTSHDLSIREVRAIAGDAERFAVDLLAAIDTAAGRSDLATRARLLQIRLFEFAGGAT